MCAIRASSQPGTFPGNQPSPTPTPLPPSPVIIEKAAPDAPLPDLGTVPTERPEARTVPQKIARKAKDFAPKCSNAPFRSDASKALERLGGGLAAGTGCAEATAQEQRPN